MSVLSNLVLNRTLLQRQLLLRRTDGTALEAIRHLVAMQGQECNAPYVGLWARVAGFVHEDLTALLHDRSVVRGALLRTTQHLTPAEDFALLRPLVQPVLDRSPRQGFGKEIAGLDLAALAAAGRELLAGQTLTRPQLGRMLAERFPGRSPQALGGTAHFLLALLHPPPSGTWGKWGNRKAVPCVLADEWTGQALSTSPQVETMVLRYLAAFGPAGVMDVQAWCGLTRLGQVLDRMRPRLRTYRDERGRELFDLPDAVLADPGLPAPVRFLPPFDNLLLGHSDRSRVIDDDDRKQVMPGMSQVRPTFLVDGFVEGTWALNGSTLLLSPFRQLSDEDTRDVVEEAGKLAAFVGEDGKAGDVAFA
ncbi:winged helix DNA-binding domain-containing protein [Streptomyces sp. NBC_00009]|uniref:winged helix DNA-binding domain-containing protein n=1 Tax=Streptomyces sp. NBC_00009 TaxID=2975620 RepID=UPI003244484F